MGLMASLDDMSSFLLKTHVVPRARAPTGSFDGRKMLCFSGASNSVSMAFIHSTR
jgi:hypothetical protein